MNKVDFNKLDEVIEKHNSRKESLFYKLQVAYGYIWRFFRDIPFNFRNLKFRLKHGFWMEEAWNVDTYTTKFLLPRLKHLRKNLHGYPVDITFEEWKQELDQIIEAFELHQKIQDMDYDWRDRTKSQDMFDRCQHGLNLFAKRYWNLWD